MNGGKTTILVIASLALFATRSAPAQDAADEEFGQFLELLDQQTSLATRTRLNADFVPGMVSVLDAAQLERRGFRTLWEALDSLPGVQTVQDGTGMRSVGVRGIGDVFEPSKVKLLLNGEAINASASATTGTIYDTPVAQIERIEFIRGPGSAIHGEFAYAGLLNVITRGDGRQYAAGIDSGGGADFAVTRGFARADGGVRGSLSLAAGISEGEDIDSGADASPATIPTYAPGPINDKRDFVSLVARLEAGRTRALLQLQQANRGDYFGTSNLLPPDERQTVISETVLSATLARGFEAGERLQGEWSLGLLRHASDKNGLFLGVAEAFGGLGGEDDIYADSELTEQRLEAGVSLRYDGPRHQLYGEISAAEIRVEESAQRINLDPVTNLPSPSVNEFPAPVDEDAERSATSLVLQDEFRLDDDMTLTSGLRVDDYEDIGSNLSPRIALVWRLGDDRVFKTQLARAFRPPSLIETGGSIRSSIDPELNDTLEFGYIYHGDDLILRHTLYYTRLEDLIVFQDFAPFGYRNAGSFELYGYELEAEKSFRRRWHVGGSLSLQDYAGEELPGAAPWMLKLGIGYEFRPLAELHLQIGSSGERARADGDPRGDFEQTTRVDLSLRRRNLFATGGLDLRAGIRNLFDQRLAHPAPAGAYPDDYPYSDGALLWLQLVYRP